MSGAVRGTAGYNEGYKTATDRSDRLSCYYIQTENIKYFEQRAMNECTVLMFSRWMVTHVIHHEIFGMHVYRIPSRDHLLVCRE